MGSFTDTTLEDLLPKLLNAIKIESLLQIFPEPVMDHSHGSGIVKPEIRTYSDIEILRTILPEKLFDASQNCNLTGTFAFSFALRHSLTWLAFLFHHAADGTIPAAGHFPGRDIENDMEIVSAFAARISPNENILPVAGFSAVGIHTAWRARSRCRAFDYYDIHYCPNHTSGIFCTEHENEMWWHTLDDDSSTQARMFEFHAGTDNYYAYDEQKLKEESARFWQAFSEWKKLQSPEKTAPALEFFSYRDTSELKTKGESELRQRYLTLAMKHHPDKGGSKSDFILLKDFYEILEAHFE